MRDYAELIKDLRESAEWSDRLAVLMGRDVGDSKAPLMRKAADAIEELLARVPDTNVGKWISVEERLPDDQCDDARAARGGDYIHKVLAVSVTPNYTAMDTAYLYNGRWALGQYTSWKHFMGAPVTHWMPLPEPPKEGTE